MKEVQIIRVHGDDWEGLYVNGRLVDEGHSLSFHDIMSSIEAAGGRVTRWGSIEVDYDWLSDLGRLPQTLREVQLIEPFPDGLIYE